MSRGSANREDKKTAKMLRHSFYEWKCREHGKRVHGGTLVKEGLKMRKNGRKCRKAKRMNRCYLISHALSHHPQKRFEIIL